MSRPGQNGSGPSQAGAQAAAGTRERSLAGSAADLGRHVVDPVPSFGLGAEDLVERVDHGLGGRARALEVHRLDRLGLVVQEAIGSLLLALVDQDLVGGLVEQRPSVEDEVRGDVLGLLGQLEERHDQVLVAAALHDHLGVHPADGPLLGREDVEVRTTLVLDPRLACRGCRWRSTPRPS